MNTESPHQKINALAVHLCRAATQVTSHAMHILELSLDGRVHAAAVFAERRTDGTTQMTLGLAPAGGGPGLRVALGDSTAVSSALSPFKGATARGLENVVRATDLICQGLAIHMADDQDSYSQESPQDHRWHTGVSIESINNILISLKKLRMELPAHWGQVAEFTRDAVRLDPSFPVTEHIQHVLRTHPRFQPEAKAFGSKIMEMTLRNLHTLMASEPHIQNMLEKIKKLQTPAPSHAPPGVPEMR